MVHSRPHCELSPPLTSTTQHWNWKGLTHKALLRRNYGGWGPSGPSKNYIERTEWWLPEVWAVGGVRGEQLEKSLIESAIYSFP